MHGLQILCLDRDLLHKLRPFSNRNLLLLFVLLVFAFRRRAYVWKGFGLTLYATAGFAALASLRNFGQPFFGISFVLLPLVIAWMSLSPLINEGQPFYEFRSELHTYLTIVFGTMAIFLVGFILTKLFPKRK